MTRIIDIYGTSLADVKRDAASVIAEQAAEGFAFDRITVARLEAGRFTHAAAIRFRKADDE